MEARLLDFADVLDVLTCLVSHADASGEGIGEPIVLVGGSAMAALGLRAQSVDVDLYVSRASADLVEEVEHELRRRYGAAFRLDVTAVENLWGPLVLRDVGDSPVVARVASAARTYVVRALRAEDLFLLKLLADRSKDRTDLPLLAAATSVDALIARFGVLAGWLGDRGALAGFADALVASLDRLYGAPARDVIARIAVPRSVRADLVASWVRDD